MIDGKIRFLSVSQIKLFDPQAEGCHRKWAFPYVFRKKLAKTDALTKGADFAEKLYHYLTTGEDVLPPVLQEAKKFFPSPGPDLECEEPLGDLPGALQGHPELAGLTVCGIPLDGAADYRHRRGVYVNEDAQIVPESSASVVEVGDLKTTVRINAHKTRTGQLLPGYAKTPAQVCEDVQMVGYAKHAIQQPRFAGLTHVRLTHVYAQTGSKGAALRTGLVSVQQVLDRWHGKVEPVVSKMIEVAQAARIEDVEPTPSSCDAFTHVGPDGKTAKGCGHRYYCPLAETAIVQNMLVPREVSAMSLFDSLPPSALGLPTTAPQAPSPPPPSVPPPTPDQHRAAVEAEKARLRAEDAGAPPPPPVPTVPTGPCGTPGCGVGCAVGWIKLGAGPGAFVECHRCKNGYVAPKKPAPVSPMAVTPPDAPPPAPLAQAADPLPPSALAEVTDPALRQTIENHTNTAARQQLELQAQEMKMSDSKWCPGSKQIIPFTTEIAMNKNKYACTTCGKEMKLEPMKQPDGSFVAMTKNHRNETKEAAPPPPPPAPPAPPIVEEMTPPPPPPVHIVRHTEANGSGLGNGFSQITTVELLKSIDESLKRLVRVQNA